MPPYVAWKPVMQQMHFNRIQHKKPVCFSFILHDSKSSQQDTQGKGSKGDINNPSLKNTSLVSKDFEHVNQESYFAASEKVSSKKLQRRYSCLSLQ